MAAGKNWAYASLAGDKSVRLVVEGDGGAETAYEVVRFSATFAINQVPEAVCVLGIGRDARDGTTLAAIHKTAAGLKRLLKARVEMTISGETSPAGNGVLTWPAGPQTIFDGYFVGLGYQKTAGRVSVVVHLTHWLADLQFSSCLSPTTHASTSAALNTLAVIPPVQGGGAAGQGATLSSLFHGSAITPLIGDDLWEAVKTLLCAMSQYEGFVPVCGDQAGLGNAVQAIADNSRAQRALSRIEGPADGPAGGKGCDAPYLYGLPLPLTLDAEQAYAAVSRAIGDIPFVTVWNMTMWDLLVNGYCPVFGLAVCPAVDRAVVVADLPGYRGDPIVTVDDASLDDPDHAAESSVTVTEAAVTEMWRTIRPEEYEFVDQVAMVPRPLRAVVVHGSHFSEGGASAQAVPATGPSCVAGVYAPDDAGTDGVVLYTSVPDWAADITQAGLHAGAMTGVTNQKPVVTATTPGANPPAPVDPVPSVLARAARSILDDYAHVVFVRECLRGRTGTISGKLRFDVAPGSHVLLLGHPERFIGGEDALAANLYAQVNRVTVEIDAEGRRANTTLGLTHIRNTAENGDDRTSAAEHPFYGRNVMLGMPLVLALAV